jgi:hypothetical protein
MGKHTWVIAILLFAATAAAAPPKGAYKIVKWIDGKETRTPEDMFKKVDMHGEIVITFDGDRISAGTWTVSKDTDDKKPDVVYVAACRGQATGQGKWTGDTLRLDGPIEFQGFVDHYVFTTTKKGKGKDHTADLHSHTLSCGFKLDEPSYKLTGAGDKVILTTNAGKQIVLERTTAIADVDTKAKAHDLWDE